MISYLFIAGTDFDLITTMLFVVLFSGIFAIVDFIYIYPAELKKQALKNPVMVKFLENQEEIIKRLDRMEKKYKER